VSAANLDLQSAVTRFLKGCEPIAVLEAGCGSTSHIDLGNKLRLTGIDISENQLRRNEQLDERILGDIQSYRWPVPRFDAVICWDVLEHLRRPAAALDNLFDAVKPGGIVVLAFPNLYSLKGLVTKLTPYFVHLWFYRLMGDYRPMEELDQFPTYLRPSMAPAPVRRHGEEKGLSVVYFRLYEGPVQAALRRRNHVADGFFGALAAASRTLSLGRFDMNLSDCMLVFRKPAPGDPGARDPGSPEGSAALKEGV
jgi:SAM-dependent methyltransferase